MNIAIWGLGKHAINNIAPALMKTPNLTLAGVYTRDEAIRNKYAKAFNCKTWESHSTMLKDSNVDIIYCSTPPALHHQMGLDVLSSGKHFWCEKPITMSLEESKSLIEHSNKANLTLAEGFMYLYHPHFNALKNELIKYPETDYAIDSKFKIDLIIDQLAAKEMYIARYYMENQKWIPALNRLKTVVDKYDKTIFIEEALHRLVEVYYKIGLIEQSKEAAAILGYNYQSSEWYERSYKVFNEKYEMKRKKEKEKKLDLLRKKIKSLF